MTTETLLLELFQRTVRDVPAYREFLAGQQVDPDTIKDYSDFSRLPLVTSRLHQPLCVAGALPRRHAGRLRHGRHVLGFDRQTDSVAALDRARIGGIESLRTGFRTRLRRGRRTTLVVICFALGSWVGGMYTAQCVRYLAIWLCTSFRLVCYHHFLLC